MGLDARAAVAPDQHRRKMHGSSEIVEFDTPAWPSGPRRLRGGLAGSCSLVMPEGFVAEKEPSVGLGRGESIGVRADGLVGAGPVVGVGPVETKPSKGFFPIPPLPTLRSLRTHRRTAPAVVVDVRVKSRLTQI